MLPLDRGAFSLFLADLLENSSSEPQHPPHVWYQHMILYQHMIPSVV